MVKADTFERKNHHHRGKFTEGLLNNEVIMKALNIKAGQTVLDAGCGNGYMSKIFSDKVSRTGKVYALDPDKYFIEILRNETKGTNIEAMEGDITIQTKLKRSSIDLIYISTVIHGFSQRQMQGFIHETNRLLKTDALLAIVEIELKFKPWLGDAFSFLYDFIMKNSIFPKKFGGDMNKHYEILSSELKGVHEKCVLELATGSGSAVNFLPNDNQYTGSDISPGLLRKAVKNFRNAGFQNADFFVASADDLPFDDNRFSIILCILSLNFFNNITKVFKEIKRVAAPDAIFICSVPVPERNKVQSTIRGTLYSEEQLRGICKEHGLSYETIPSENGALLYFRAIKQ